VTVGDGQERADRNRSGSATDVTTTLPPPTDKSEHLFDISRRFLPTRSSTTVLRDPDTATASPITGSFDLGPRNHSSQEALGPITPMSRPTGSLRKDDPLPASDVVTRQDAAHLLRRAGFGGSDAELTALSGQTREACVSAVMGFADGDPVPEGPDVGHPAWVVNVDQWEVHAEILSWWYNRMATLPNPISTPGVVPAVAAPNPLQEKMVLFWHDHFACGQEKLYDIAALWDQMRMFRRRSLGSFTDLLRATSVHPAMLVFLDNESNVVGAEQENFARELMELYTIGVGNFSESDVVAMARAWTGHNTIGWTGSFWDSTYVYRSESHDHGSKTLFGITDNWNGVAVGPGERDTIDELCTGVKQPQTARFIARKLFRWFAHSSPSDPVVQNLAGLFVASGMSIAALVRAILEHDEFWGPESRWAQVTTPTEWMVRLLKRIPVAPADAGLRWRMESVGQVLLDPPSVAGWPSGSAWMSTAGAWGRGGVVSGLRWTASEAGFLAGVRYMNAADGAQEIFDAFGLEEVSSATRIEVQQWLSAALADAPWSIAPQGCVMGALCPEFQVQ
jgi:hypothetical protein